MGFRTPDLKKAIKVAQEMGLPVKGFEIGPGGELRVMTSGEAQSDADTVLESWRRLHGKAT